MKWTPTQAEPQDGIKVIIPKTSVELFLSDHMYNLWNIKSRAKCSMTLHVATADTDKAVAKSEERSQDMIESGNPSEQGKQASTDPYIIFSGQPTAIAAAIDEILTVAKTVSVVNPPGAPHTVLHDGQANEETIRGLLAHPSVTKIQISHYQMSVPCKPYELRIRADEIPLPPKWTVETFQQYVAALVMGRYPKTLAAKLYTNTGHDSHQNTVVARLVGVFNDPSASAAVSSPAAKLALSYFVRCGETFVNEARMLVDRVKKIGMPMDTQIYNLLAETAVKSKNLLAFETIVERMIRDGYKPDKRTWILFLRIIEAEEVRRYIMHSMHSKNLFEDPSVVRAVAVEMADQDVYRAIQLGQDVDTFLAGLRKLYGEHWHLPSRSANRYLEILGRYSQFDEIKKLLEHMFAGKHGKPNTVTLATILRHCKEQRKVDLAVEFVRLFDKHGFHVADDQCIHYLFEMGRRIFKPHLLGAVWRYAHLTRLDSSVMRHRGREFLDSGPDGARKLLKITDRIRHLWEGPKPCRITRSEFVTSLLLYDYQKAVGDPGRVTLGSLAGAEKAEDPGPRKLAMAPPQLRSEEQYPRFASAVRSKEGTGPGSPTEPEPVTDSFGDLKPVTRIRSRKQKYDPYEQWVFARAQGYKPAIGLGDFLQEALDRDRRLHRLAYTGEGVVKGGVPVDLVPPELPVIRAPRDEKKMDRMWNWENVGGRLALRFSGEDTAWVNGGEKSETGAVDEMDEVDEVDEVDDSHAPGQTEKLGGKCEATKVDEVDVIDVMREMAASAGGNDAGAETAQLDDDLGAKLIRELEAEKKRTSETLLRRAALYTDEGWVARRPQPATQSKHASEPLLKRLARGADGGQVAMRRLALEPRDEQQSQQPSNQASQPSKHPAPEQPTHQASEQPIHQASEQPIHQASEQPTKRHVDDLWDEGFVKGPPVAEDLSALFGDVGNRSRKQRAQRSARSKRTAEKAGKQKPAEGMTEEDVWDKMMSLGAKIEREQKLAARNRKPSF